MSHELVIVEGLLRDWNLQHGQVLVVRIEKFKRRFGQKALFGSYNDLSAFEGALRNHLASTMHELLKQKPAHAT